MDITKHVREILRARADEKRQRVTEARRVARQAEDEKRERARAEADLRRLKRQMMRNLRRCIRRMRLAALPRVWIFVDRSPRRSGHYRTGMIVRLTRFPLLARVWAIGIEPHETADGWRYRVYPPNLPGIGGMWVFEEQAGLTMEEVITYLAQRTANVIDPGGSISTQVPQLARGTSGPATGTKTGTSETSGGRERAASA